MRISTRLHPVARQKVGFAGSHWIGALVRHKGHPPALTCGHKHAGRIEAKECAEAMLHCDPGSLMAEKIAKAEGRL